jgi:DNA-binding response OmpR family regulator
MSDATILIIEDNPDILEAVRLILQHEGFTVLAAGDCSIAFDHISRCRPDVILTDLTLPKMTGLEFIQVVRSMACCEDIPIIAISAFDDSYLLAAMKAGADAILQKPEGLDQLINTVRNLLPDLSPTLTATEQTGVDLDLSPERLAPALGE